MASSPTSPSVPFAPAQPDVWRDLSAALDRLADTARRETEVGAFHQQLLTACAECLSAQGGVVWSAAEAGPALTVSAALPVGAAPTELQSPAANELRTAALAAAAPTTHPLGGGVVALAPLREEPQTACVALVELLLPGEQGPAFARGVEDFLLAVGDIAGEFYRRQELVSLRREQQLQRRLLGLARAGDPTQSLHAAALRIVNDARRTLGCDRVSLVRTDRRRPQLLAASGVERVDRRAPSVAALERIAGAAAKLREPIQFGIAGESPHAPALETLLDSYADQAHCRALVAAPLFSPGEQNTPRVEGVLIAEDFGGENARLDSKLIAEAADACRGGYANSLAWEQAPLGGLVRAAHRLGWRQIVSRGVLFSGLAASVVAALVLVPAEFHVAARGRVQPTVARELFAPVAGVVDVVHTAHGAAVEADEEVLVLRAPELALEMSKLTGELDTLTQRLQSLRATRTGLDARNASEVDRFRLSADERQLAQQIAGYQRELALLRSQQSALSVRSPLAGRVLTWEAAQKLTGRAVERGQLLLSIADTAAPWRVELDVPDDQIGVLLSAAAEQQAPLRVEFELTSASGVKQWGEIESIAAAAEEQSPTTERTVCVRVTPRDKLTIDDHTLLAGLSVRARIPCGQRSVGYVWLHDLWNTLRTWWKF